MQCLSFSCYSISLARFSRANKGVDLVLRQLKKELVQNVHCPDNMVTWEKKGEEETRRLTHVVADVNEEIKETSSLPVSRDTEANM